MNMLMDQLRKEGFAVFPLCLDESTLADLGGQFADNYGPQRNILDLGIVRELASCQPVRRLMEAVLGPKCFAVRGLFFNKTEDANWKVAWHQDLTIAVRERRDAEGFGPWTMKAGVWHVQPPTNLMSELLAIRLHLDESAADNGPLRVIVSSHKEGRLSPEQIVRRGKNRCVTCMVPKGGALVMNPLLLHASSACAINKPRRVIHLEFANGELPYGLEWKDRI